MDKIAKLALSLKEDMIKDRRYFHSHPETGWFTFFTTAVLAKRLSELGYEVKLGEEVVKSDARLGVGSKEQCQKAIERAKSLEMTKKEWAVLAGAVVAFGVQIYTELLPLGALLGLLVMVVFGGIEYKKVDKIMDNGLAMMGFIAFIMLVAAGYGTILRESGGIDELVKYASLVSGGKIGGAFLMLLIGLLVTMGIGTSFGTIPILASIYVPLCLSLGFGVPAIILLVGIAAALGDAGSPASDSTLGPTSGLNADGEHNHIYDTCVPTFIFFNIPLIIGGIVGAMILG